MKTCVSKSRRSESESCKRRFIHNLPRFVSEIYVGVRIDCVAFLGGTLRNGDW